MNWKDVFKKILTGAASGLAQGLDSQTGETNWAQAGIVAGFGGLIAIVNILTPHPAVQAVKSARPNTFTVK